MIRVYFNYVFLGCLVLFFPQDAFTKTLGKCLETIDLYHSPFVATRENMIIAATDSFSLKNTKTIRIAALINKNFKSSFLIGTGWSVCGDFTNNNIITLEGLESTYQYLSAIPGIVTVENISKIYPCMDSARQETHVNEVHGTVPNSLSQHFTGKGVIFGIIDNEFDTHQPAFLDSLGHTRFLALWDQTNTSKKTPNRFGYGVIKRGNDLDKDTLFGSDSSEEHGTNMTSLGAGSDRKSPYYGVATDALIVAAKYGNAGTDVINGLKWIMSIADSLQKPCVINMSIGTHQGPHDGTSLIDQTIDSLGKAGRIIVGAAGNDGGDRKCHLLFPLKAGESRGTWIVPFTYQTISGGISAFSEVEIWGSANKTFTDTLLISDISTNSLNFKKITNLRTTRLPQAVFWYDSITKKTDTISIQIISERNATNNKQHLQIYSQCSNPNLLIGFKIASAEEHTVHAWNLYKLGFKNLNLPEFYSGDSLYTINEVGGTAKRIITAGGYESKFRPLLFNDSIYDKETAILHSYLVYTSRGPTADGRIKPDISAPGREVTGAASRYAKKSEGRFALWPDTNSTMGRYQFAGGTSLASPIVAGIIALMLEADPTLTPESAKDILQKSALKDEFTGPLSTPDVIWGAGKVNALGAFIQMGIPISIKTKNSLFQTSLQFWLIGKNKLRITGIISNKTEATISLFDMAGRLISTFAINKNQVINLPQSLHGCYVLKILYKNKVFNRSMILGF